MNTGTVILIAAGAYLIFRNKSGSTASTFDKKNSLINYSQQNFGSESNIFVEAVNLMNDVEIAATYDYIFNYWIKGIQLVQGSSLYNQVQAISLKYNIFT